MISSSTMIYCYEHQTAIAILKLFKLYKHLRYFSKLKRANDKDQPLGVHKGCFGKHPWPTSGWAQELTKPKDFTLYRIICYSRSGIHQDQSPGFRAAPKLISSRAAPSWWQYPAQSTQKGLKVFQNWFIKLLACSKHFKCRQHRRSICYYCTFYLPLGEISLEQQHILPSIKHLPKPQNSFQKSDFKRVF